MKTNEDNRRETCRSERDGDYIIVGWNTWR